MSSPTETQHNLPAYEVAAKENLDKEIKQVFKSQHTQMALPHVSLTDECHDIVKGRLGNHLLRTVTEFVGSSCWGDTCAFAEH